MWKLGLICGLAAVLGICYWVSKRGGFDLVIDLFEILGRAGW